jgi:hypothetical protein
MFKRTPVSSPFEQTPISSPFNHSEEEEDPSVSHSVEEEDPSLSHSEEEEDLSESQLDERQKHDIAFSTVYGIILGSPTYYLARRFYEIFYPQDECLYNDAEDGEFLENLSDFAADNGWFEGFD